MQGDRRPRNSASSMNSEKTADLEFWFDFASTYSYIAASRIEGLCRAADLELKWKPFLLGPIFKLQGWNDSHFNLNPRRGVYMWRDMERLAHKFAIPWKRPSAFPRPSTLPARIACSIADESWCGDFIRAVFSANFARDLDIAETSVIADVLTQLGQPAESIIEHSQSPSRRAILRANTERAIEIGIFGAPNCLVRDELFWGEESLEDAIEWARR
jgi:2-hydroxychromene-2-carboxylate isomerase